MTVQLTSKETSLLKDQRSHEQICIQKYKNYASQASDPQLKQLLNTYAEQEQQHLNTITQMLNGQVPTMSTSAGQSTQQTSMQSTASAPVASSGQSTTNQSDSALCNDMLMTEKFVSGTYDTAIFEFKDTAMRQALNHIQKEEQDHGNGIFQYMQSHGMYNPE